MSRRQLSEQEISNLINFIMFFLKKQTKEIYSNEVFALTFLKEDGFKKYKDIQYDIYLKLEFTFEGDRNSKSHFIFSKLQPILVLLGLNDVYVVQWLNQEESEENFLVIGINLEGLIPMENLPQEIFPHLNESH